MFEVHRSGFQQHGRFQEFCGGFEPGRLGFLFRFGYLSLQELLFGQLRISALFFRKLKLFEFLSVAFRFFFLVLGVPLGL